MLIPPRGNCSKSFAFTYSFCPHSNPKTCVLATPILQMRQWRPCSLPAVTGLGNTAWKPGVQAGGPRAWSYNHHTPGDSQMLICLLGSTDCHPPGMTTDLDSWPYLWAPHGHVELPRGETAQGPGELGGGKEGRNEEAPPTSLLLLPNLPSRVFSLS